MMESQSSQKSLTQFPLPEFMFDEQYGRYPMAKSKDPYTCGLSGKTIKAAKDQKTRIDHLARSLKKELGWEVNKGSEYDKVAGIFALNTVCTPPLFDIYK